ncbi:hypothetical protein GHT07_17730 [Caenimonas koreensis DSM 17982]|uniref:Cu and Ag efflux protein CusF n=1 Tax=Caenimonas koreensis DSM 17982 TaxID=1121255 RepID=A0A844AX59_9BURK|nr:hypothetical protein [Caenimonas koreensis DSM 17982]
MRKLALAVTLASAALATPALHAQAQASAAALTEGEVRKIDKENRKLTLRHAEIKNIDMPAMTMVFEVSDAAMLDRFKPGDKVRFAVSNERGKLTVTEIQPAP